MHTEILSPTPENLARAAQALGRAEVVGMPTETVYGLAGGAFQPEALARIFSVKERPTFDPLIVHVVPAPTGLSVLDHLAALGVVEPAQLRELARARIETLAGAFWPGPLTLVLPRGPRIPDLVTSGLDTVAVRTPGHPVAQALLRAAGVPLAAPSANRFGRISPTSAQHVLSELGGRIGLILDGGPCEVGLESSVLAVADDGALTLLRPGGVGREAIAQLLSAEVELPEGPSPVEQAAPAPGMLASHYAPRKPLHLLSAPLAKLARWESATWPSTEALPARLGLLALAGESSDLARRARELTGRDVSVQVLSAKGELAEAARSLFAAMRALDASEAEVLFAEPISGDEGLSHAIRDRLSRAAKR